MDGTVFFGFCKCDNAHICIFCKALSVICIAAIGGLIGFVLGRKR